MATLLELAKDAFKNHNYILSCEIYERLLRESGRKSTELYFGYGDSLAKCARIKEALDIYAHICYQLCEIIPVEKLKCLASSIIEFIVTRRTNASSNHLSMAGDSDGLDPLCCPVCEDVLKYPVTSLCGHTFCRECCFGRTKCIVCGQKFPVISAGAVQESSHPLPPSSSSSASMAAAVAGALLSSPVPSTSATTTTTTNSALLTTSSTSVAIMKNSTITSEISSINNDTSDMGDMSDVYQQWSDGVDSSNTIISGGEEDDGCGGFEQDILVRRLIEKWWNPLLKVSEMNDEADGYLQRNLLDDALKCCNQSLEQGELMTY
jgi:hypothetical protein